MIPTFNRIHCGSNMPADESWQVCSFVCVLYVLCVLCVLCWLCLLGVRAAGVFVGSWVCVYVFGSCVCVRCVCIWDSGVCARARVYLRGFVCLCVCLGLLYVRMFLLHFISFHIIQVHVGRRHKGQAGLGRDGAPSSWQVH
jgi:hypothetical protein